jgi:hypothetical protein
MTGFGALQESARGWTLPLDLIARNDHTRRFSRGGGRKIQSDLLRESLKQLVLDANASGLVLSKLADELAEQMEGREVSAK